jgi:Ca2+-binding EF-hand superfamily protein
MNIKTILAATALAMSVGVATADTFPRAYAKDMAMAMDVNKDGTVTKEEFLKMMAKKYDEKMDAMKKMAPAEAAKMMKGEAMTTEGFISFFSNLH